VKATFRSLDRYFKKENEMRIPARYAPLLFSALLSAIMVCIVSAFVLITTQGFHPGLFFWLKVARHIAFPPSPWWLHGYENRWPHDRSNTKS
jgi:hypothetical protein